jgi:hypothetical protein
MEFGFTAKRPFDASNTPFFMSPRMTARFHRFQKRIFPGIRPVEERLRRKCEQIEERERTDGTSAVFG